jgi:hypothetical protein
LGDDSDENQLRRLEMKKAIDFDRYHHELKQALAIIKMNSGTSNLQNKLIAGLKQELIYISPKPLYVNIFERIKKLDSDVASFYISLHMRPKPEIKGLLHIAYFSS